MSFKEIIATDFYLSFIKLAHNFDSHGISDNRKFDLVKCRRLYIFNSQKCRRLYIFNSQNSDDTKMGVDATKPVFRVSDKARLKPVSSDELDD